MLPAEIFCRQHLFLMRLLITVISLLLVAGTSFARQSPAVFPEPRKLVYGNGSWPLKNLVVYQPAGLKADITFALQQWTGIVTAATGKPVRKTSSPATASFTYRIHEAGKHIPDTSELRVRSNREAYSLKVDHRGISVSATTSTGLFYAIQTLRQLMVKGPDGYSIPFVEVEDRPELPYRGVMMDFAHGGLLTVEEIKRQISFLAQWKANQFYFYNEVSIALDGFEGINFKQSYSKEQIREIIQYGLQRHIDVVPFMAFYGHQHDLVKLERYADLGIGNYGHEFDPRKPAVTELLKNWIRQYAELFPSPFIHVGFDETWETHRIAKEYDSSLQAQDLWLSHLKAVHQELRKYGKTVMAWTDMSHYYPQILSRFPDDVIPVIWEYSPDSAALYHYLDPVLKSGRRYFIQPAVSGWGHIYPAANYTYDNIDLCLQIGKKEGTLGFITSVWTDAVEPLVRPSWLFMGYGCVAAWQGKSPGRQEFEAVFSRTAFPPAADQVSAVLSKLAHATDLLRNCYGKNTSNMPGGTIIESWSNPFQDYYLNIARTHEKELRQVRVLTEEAESLLIDALQRTDPSAQSFLESLRVTSRLIHYQATRFLFAKVICERWDNAMLLHKQNNFVFYDISYLCHGLIQDVMDEMGTLKSDYSAAWLSESMPYRLQTILGRFDVEYGLWQKLLLKVIDYRVKTSTTHVAPASFVEVFRPDF